MKKIIILKYPLKCCLKKHVLFDKTKCKLNKLTVKCVNVTSLNYLKHCLNSTDIFCRNSIRLKLTCLNFQGKNSAKICCNVYSRNVLFDKIKNKLNKLTIKCVELTLPNHIKHSLSLQINFVVTA